MKANIFDLLDYLSRTGADMCSMNIVKKDGYATLKEYTGVVGKHSDECVKKGMYLYSDAFDNDAELLSMADAIYNHEIENIKILYFAIS